MFIYHLARTRPLYCLLRRVPRRSDLSVTAMHWQACSGWCPPTSSPHRLLNALSDLHRPLCRSKCAAVPNGVRLRHLFLTASLIYIYLDGRLPPRTPLNFQSQITGNLAVYGFAFSPFSSTPSPLVSGCIPSLTFAGAHAYSFLIVFQGRRNCDFSTTPGANSCLDGGCNGGLQCDPHTGTVRLSPTISFTYTQLTRPLCLPFPLPTLIWVPCRVYRPQRWRNGRSRATGIKTFTMVRMTFLPIPPPLVRKLPD
jgi:hypothetical protein